MWTQKFESIRIVHTAEPTTRSNRVRRHHSVHRNELVSPSVFAIFTALHMSEGFRSELHFYLLKMRHLHALLLRASRYCDNLQTLVCITKLDLPTCSTARDFNLSITRSNLPWNAASLSRPRIWCSRAGARDMVRYHLFPLWASCWVRRASASAWIMFHANCFFLFSAEQVIVCCRSVAIVLIIRVEIFVRCIYSTSNGVNFVFRLNGDVVICIDAQMSTIYLANFRSC